MITVLFQTESHYPVKKKLVEEAITRVLLEKIRGSVEVSVSVVGDRMMRKLNMQYRQIAQTTDVLSFPQNDPTQTAEPFASPPDETIRLGDIIVSYPQAVLTASEEDKLVDEVIVDLVLHGLNHLLGIHHD